MRPFLPGRIILGALILSLAASGGCSTGLAKVRVAADGRHLETANGKPFVPFGVNYYRPGTGWPPKIWQKFDPAATDKDMALLHEYGGNCVRVFVTSGSMYPKPGELSADGMAKFDQFLDIAEAHGIYVHPTGPEGWEGRPAGNLDPYSEPGLESLETFWKLFAARYKDRNVIFAYDLRNEPNVPWEGRTMQARWNLWVKDHYATAEAAARAWGVESVDLAKLAIPRPVDKPGDRMLLDFQNCREDTADEWTRRQVAAIKSVDPDALVTVGCIQYTVPANQTRLSMYAGYRPARQAKYLDFLSLHFYPLEHGGYEYDDPIMEQRNLAYLQAIAREVAKAGKPVVITEFGWYGGGTYSKGRNGGDTKFATEQQQADIVAKFIQVTDGLVCGWINWGMFDHPEARDCSRCTGLFTPDGKPKAWAIRFKELAAHYSGRKIEPRDLPRDPSAFPDLPWDACLTSTQAGTDFRNAYFQAFQAP